MPVYVHVFREFFKMMGYFFLIYWIDNHIRSFFGFRWIWCRKIGLPTSTEEEIKGINYLPLKSCNGISPLNNTKNNINFTKNKNHSLSSKRQCIITILIMIICVYCSGIWKPFLIYVFQFCSISDSWLVIKMSYMRYKNTWDWKKLYSYCFNIQNIWNKVEKSLDLLLFIIIIILFLQWQSIWWGEACFGEPWSLSLSYL